MQWDKSYISLLVLELCLESYMNPYNGYPINIYITTFLFLNSIACLETFKRGIPLGETIPSNSLILSTFSLYLSLSQLELIHLHCRFVWPHSLSDCVHVGFSLSVVGMISLKLVSFEPCPSLLDLIINFFSHILRPPMPSLLK